MGDARAVGFEEGVAHERLAAALVAEVAEVVRAASGAEERQDGGELAEVGHARPQRRFAVVPEVIDERQRADKAVLADEVILRADEAEAIGLEQGVAGDQGAVEQGFVIGGGDISTHLGVEDALAVAQAFQFGGVGLLQGVFRLAGGADLRGRLDGIDAPVQHHFRLWRDGPHHHRPWWHLLPRRGVAFAANAEAAVFRHRLQSVGGEVAQVAVAKFPDAALPGILALAVFRLDGKAFLPQVEVGQLLFVVVDGAAGDFVMSGGKVGSKPADKAVAVQRFCLDAHPVQGAEEGTDVIEQFFRRSFALPLPVRLALQAVDADVDFLRGDAPAFFLGDARVLKCPQLVRQQVAVLAQEAHHVQRQFVLAQMLRQAGVEVVAEVVDVGVLQVNLHDVGVVRIVFFLRQLRQRLCQRVIEGGERFFRLGVHVGRGAFPYRADVDAVDHGEYPVLPVVTFHREVVGKAGLCLEQVAVVFFKQRDGTNQRRNAGHAEEEVFQGVHWFHRVHPSAAPSRISAL